jgi:hypothetical protein
MIEGSENVPHASTSEAKLAFVEGFLLGLARRLDDAGYNWPKASEAADDCRAVAAMVKQVGVPMERAPPANSK